MKRQRGWLWSFAIHDNPQSHSASIQSAARKKAPGCKRRVDERHRDALVQVLDETHRILTISGDRVEELTVDIAHGLRKRVPSSAIIEPSQVHGITSRDENNREPCSNFGDTARARYPEDCERASGVGRSDVLR